MKSSYYTKFIYFFIAVCFTLTLHAQDGFSDCLDAYKNGDYKKTIECLNDYIYKNPKDVDALFFRSKCYGILGDYKSAFTDINNAIANYNKNAKAQKEDLYTQRGQYYVDIENYNQALKDYETAHKINSKYTDVLFDRANLYYTLKNYSASDNDWKDILKIEKDNMNAQIGLARNMIARGQTDDAIKELDRLERIEPTNPFIFAYRSDAYAKKEDYRSAIDDLIDWCDYDDIDSAKADILAEYSGHELTYALAKVSEKVVKAKDDNEKYKWLLLRNSLYTIHGMYKKAIEDYNAIETLTSNPNERFYFVRGNCYANLGEYDKAIADYNEGLKLGDDKNLYNSKASVKRLKGDYKSAITNFSKVIELDPMNSNAYFNRGWTKELDKNYQGALKDYTTSIKIDNKVTYPYFFRGRLYLLQLNDFLSAKKDFQMALSLDTVIRIDGNCCQFALFYLGRSKEAIALQDSILEKYPTSNNYFDATCLYSLLDRQSDAIKYLKLAFEKGYRSFYLMQDNIGLDNIRNTEEYKDLVEEWKNKAAMDIESSFE